MAEAKAKAEAEADVGRGCWNVVTESGNVTRAVLVLLHALGKRKKRAWRGRPSPTYWLLIQVGGDLNQKLNIGSRFRRGRPEPRVHIQYSRLLLLFQKQRLFFLLLTPECPGILICALVRFGSGGANSTEPVESETRHGRSRSLAPPQGHTGQVPIVTVSMCSY